MTMAKQFLPVLVLFTMAACATTQQANTVERSGFLDDYSILQKGAGDSEALLRYVNPVADWKQYTKVMIDPVQIWIGEGSSLRNIPQEDRIRLTSLLLGKLRNALLPDYRIVREAGPHVMRLSVALTEAEASQTVLDTISSVLPTGYVFSGTKSLATGTGTFVGSASVEAKMTDAELGTLLAAAVDRRGGAKSLSGVTSEWDDVEESFQYWANTLRYRLCQWRGEYSCVQPTE
ncbi:MAG: lipoprotein [Nitrospirales bacterium]|nr:MAG: lipoprotein [Nitrospirales bacterium]